MKQRDVLMLMDGVAPAIASLLGKAMAPMAARLAELEKQLVDARAELAARPDVGALVDAAVAKALADQPKPEPVDISGLQAEIAAIPDTVKTAVDGLRDDMQNVVLADMQAAADKALAEVKAEIAAIPKAPTAEEVAALIPLPEPGKSVTLDEVAPLVDRAVAGAFATMPGPKDGESVDPAAVKAMVEEAVAALPPAKDGASVTLDDVRPVVEEALKTAVDALPKPLDGKSVTAEELRPMVEEAAARAAAALPAARDGADATPEQIAAEVEKVLATWERPKDGERGLPGADGRDGADVADALIDREGGLVLTLTNGAVKALGVVVGKDGAPGAPGLDGLGFNDMEVVDDGMTFTLRLQRGDHIKEWTLAKPTLADMHKGIWREGAYARGSVVTWAGSTWLAKSDTDAKPETTDAWVLVTKRGRDGRDGELKAPAEPKPVKLK